MYCKKKKKTTSELICNTVVHLDLSEAIYCFITVSTVIKPLKTKDIHPISKKKKNKTTHNVSPLPFLFLLECLIKFVNLGLIP